MNQDIADVVDYDDALSTIHSSLAGQFQRKSSQSDAAADSWTATTRGIADPNLDRVPQKHAACATPLAAHDYVPVAADR